MLEPLSMLTLLAAGQPPIVWQEDFDSAQPPALYAHFEVPSENRNDDSRLIFAVQDGAAKVGGRFGQGDPYSRVRIAWGRGNPSGFWVWESTSWGPFDVAQYPILEARVRKAPDLAPDV